MRNKQSMFLMIFIGRGDMMKSILEEACCEEAWLSFLDYKIERQHLSRTEEQEIRDFVERRAYVKLCEAWKKGVYPEEHAKKSVISKEGTGKKRVVYSFTGDEGIFLKFVAYHLFRYNEVFCRNCYAFRRGYGVRDALRRLRSDRRIPDQYCLKMDISNYFNSINVEILLEKLEFVRRTDEKLYQLFERILLENLVIYAGEEIVEEHGAMAGTPISPFLANVYLSETDYYFEELGVSYYRYSDDILIFADTYEDLKYYEGILRERIAGLGLSINPDKVTITGPGEEFSFLGFAYRNGEIDLSPNTIRKTKARIKRKANALMRWQRKKGLDSAKAAVGFIRAMNVKFYGCKEPERQIGESLDSGLNEFTWERWFFPNLTTDKGLKEIDAYMQQYIRYTVTGRHYKGNFRIGYETLKEWGYRNLVHEYYAYRSKKVNGIVDKPMRAGLDILGNMLENKE